VVDITNSGYKAAMFKAEDDTGLGAEIAVKVFRRNYIPSDLFDDFFAELVSYQAGTDDDNILPLLGTATLAGERALLYPHMPKTLEDLLAAHPDGLPFDLIDYFIPQILNAVGYCHIHRGKDDVARRSPHMNIKPSKFLMDEYNSIVKLEDTGLWIAVTHNRGHKGYLWEEPGADLSALAPETFVLETKSLNGFYVDIYALGAILYRMATGKRLFTAEDVKGYSFAHLRTYAAPPRVIRWQVPAWLDTMVLKCVEKDPTKRWRSATQMELSVGREFHG
jgi:serine/threonine protein kinase